MVGISHADIKWKIAEPCAVEFHRAARILQICFHLSKHRISFVIRDVDVDLPAIRIKPGLAGVAATFVRWDIARSKPFDDFLARRVQRIVELDARLGIVKFDEQYIVSAP
jgi:hypothetical protein